MYNVVDSVLRLLPSPVLSKRLQEEFLGQLIHCVMCSNKLLQMGICLNGIVQMHMYALLFTYATS